MCWAIRISGKDFKNLVIAKDYSTMGDEIHKIWSGLEKTFDKDIFYELGTYDVGRTAIKGNFKYDPNEYVWKK